MKGSYKLVIIYLLCVLNSTGEEFLPEKIIRVGSIEISNKKDSDAIQSADILITPHFKNDNDYNLEYNISIDGKVHKSETGETVFSENEIEKVLIKIEGLNTKKLLIRVSKGEMSDKVDTVKFVRQLVDKFQKFYFREFLIIFIPNNNKFFVLYGSAMGYK